MGSPAAEHVATTLDRTALVVVDLQTGYDDPCWGRRNNWTCEEHIVQLAGEWSRRRRPLVYARHDPLDSASPLHPRRPGNTLRRFLPEPPDLLVVKSGSSAFAGRPDLAAWLRRRFLTGVVVVGLTTNDGVESTARSAADLGFHVTVVPDATHTFDTAGPDGRVLSAEALTRATVVSLYAGFAEIVDTTELLHRSTLQGTRGAQGSGTKPVW